tara:strand:- start:7 stop:1617 length:1611 start_codon:yes stop_codon:yes gene_type:complete
MRYGTHGNLDDQSVRDGDEGFLGFASRLDPGIIKESYAAEATNMRFDRGVAIVRKGTQVLQTGLSGPFHAIGEIIDGSNNVKVALVGESSTHLWEGDILDLPATLPFVLGSGGSTLDYPAGETVTAADRPFIVQAMNSIIIFRGDKTPLVLEGHSGGLQFTPLQLPSVLPFALGQDAFSTSTIPASPMGVEVGGRLVVIKDNYTLAFSNSGTLVFDAINEFPVNLGDNDPIVAVSPYQEDKILIWKERSIHIMTNISTLSDSVISEVTRQHGLQARDSVAQVGDQVFYLSTSGISALTGSVGSDGTSIRVVKVVDDPLSAPIDDLVAKIDMKWSRSYARGCYHDNRYYLAVPMTDLPDHTSGNNAVLVYSMLNHAWESRDTLKLNPDMLVPAMYGGQRRLMLAQRSGTLVLADQDSTDYNSATTGNDTIVGTLKTRRYHHNNRGELKRYRVGAFNWETLGDSSATISYKVTTNDPDTEMSSRTVSTTGSNESTRTPITFGRSRGQGIQVQFTTAGRVKIKNLYLQGTTSINQFQTS